MMKVILAILMVSMLAMQVCAEDHEAERAKKPNKCKKPTAPFGTVYFRGCYQYECVKKTKKKSAWEKSAATSKCCLFEQALYPVGSLVFSNTTVDDCVNSALTCENIQGIPSLRILIQNNCQVCQELSTTTSTSTTATTTTTTTTSTTTTTTTSTTTSTTTTTTKTTISATTNTFSSPNFPNNFPSNIEECWVQTPSDGEALTLKFTDFDLHNTGTGSNANWVTISPSINGRSKFWGNSLSDANAPPATHTFSTDVLATVCFTVPQSTDGHRGFKAEFSDSSSTIPALVKGTVETAASTQIMSPNHPSYYPANVEQCWVQTPSSGASMNLDFSSFDIHTPASTYGDWVAISPPINGRTKFWGNSFSAAEAPPQTTSFPVDQTITICLKTRSVVDSHKGFSATLTEGAIAKELSANKVILPSECCGYLPSYCIDGNKDTYCHTDQEPYPWLALDMGKIVNVTKTTIFNKNRVCCWDRLRDVEVWIDIRYPQGTSAVFNGGSKLGFFAGPGQQGEVIELGTATPLAGRYVVIVQNSKGSFGPDYLNIAEIRVEGFS